MSKKLFSLFISVILLVFSGYSNSFSGEFDIEQELAKHKGKVIYLDYWASWCIPCRKSFPWMNAMQEKYGSDNFTVLSVNLDADKVNATDFLKNYKADFPVLYDPQGISARKLRVKGMPSSYLIDHNGQFKSAHVGFFTDKTEMYEKEIVDLLRQAR